MAKQSGLGWTTMSVATSGGTPTDIRNDCTQLDFSTPKAVQDITGIDKFAHERLLLLVDFTLNLQGVFNPAVSHTVFSDISSTSVNRATSIVVGGKTLGPVNAVYTDYPLTRAAGGDLTWKVTGNLADGAVPTWS
ncbi:MAG TPA: hypothetical protein VHX38_18955 [Pseudonocardiaceae bacterium]|jgi:hypothetical protein|nr:hypothetical protein [Pseudonocardiaceae bacterium]